MKESLDLINSNKIYKKIFLEIYSKYKKYGKITGSFTLKAATTEERRILSNFLLNNSLVWFKTAGISEAIKYSSFPTPTITKVIYLRL